MLTPILLLTLVRDASDFLLACCSEISMQGYLKNQISFFLILYLTLHHLILRA